METITRKVAYTPANETTNAGRIINIVAAKPLSNNRISVRDFGGSIEYYVLLYTNISGTNRSVDRVTMQCIGAGLG